MKYASIHNHSDASIQDGLAKPAEIIKTAIDKNIDAIALTDHGNLNGIADFYTAAEKNNFVTKHIFGIEAYLVNDLEKNANDRKELDELKETLSKEELKGRRKKVNSYAHVVLLAQNNVGLENIFQLNFLSHKYGFYRKPRIDKKLLEKYNEGIITTSSCIAGPISRIASTDGKNININNVVKEVEWWKSVFGDRYFLELQFNEIPWQDTYNKILLKINKFLKIPYIVTTDSHYIKQEHHKIYDILKMLEGNKMMNMTDEELEKTKLDNETLVNDEFKCENLYLKSAEEILSSASIFSKDINKINVEEAIDNSFQLSTIIDTIHLDRSLKIPVVYDENNIELSEEECMQILTKVAIKNLKDRNLHVNKVYVDRLKTEISTIQERNLGTYFYIIYDIYKYGLQNQLAGPGRGSGGGSLLLHLLDIIALDPIKYDIMFERFLSPGRCLVPTTKIMMNDSVKQINKVIKNDIVKNINSEDIVKNVFKYNKKEKLLKIKYHDDFIICTKNHRLLVYNKDKIEYKLACDITLNDYLVEVKK